jgi:hypothetical protein
MGITPKESDILVDQSDMLGHTQEAFRIYSFLPDMWEGTSGSYLGKNFTGVGFLFKLYGLTIEEQKYTLMIMQHMDVAMSASIKKKQDASSKQKPQG